MEEGCNSTVVAVVIAALQEVEMEQGCSRSSCGNSSTSRRWRWRKGVVVLVVVVVIAVS